MSMAAVEGAAVEDRAIRLSEGLPCDGSLCGGSATGGVHRHAVVVTAAGSSVRFNESTTGTFDCGCIPKADSSVSCDSKAKKEFLEIEGVSILARSIAPFLSVPGLAVVVVTYRDGLREETADCLRCLGEDAMAMIHFVEGGRTRQDSVFNALSHLKELHANGLAFDLVSIHDGARPFVSEETIGMCLDAAFEFGGAAPCVPISDTLVKVEDGFVAGRVDRTGVHGVQTPQTFRFPDIFEAHVQARRTECVYTDDTQVFAAFGGRVAAVPGDPSNRKITFRKDLEGHR